MAMLAQPLIATFIMVLLGLLGVAILVLGRHQKWATVAGAAVIAVVGLIGFNAFFGAGYTMTPGLTPQRGSSTTPVAIVDPSAPVVFAGPFDLDRTWRLSEGLSLTRNQEIASTENLLMAGIYDEFAKKWLVEPAPFQPENGSFSLAFRTGLPTSFIRIYALRSANGVWAYKPVQLDSNRDYTATWNVEIAPNYKINGLVITSP